MAVVVDLSGVEFMDSATIDAILQARSSLASQGERLVVRRPSPAARRLLELYRLNRSLAAVADPGPHRSPPGRPGSPPRPANLPGRAGLRLATD